MSRKLIQVWLDEKLHSAFSKIAQNRDMSITGLVRHLVVEEIERANSNGAPDDVLSNIQGSVRIVSDRTEYLILAVNGLLKYHDNDAVFDAVRKHHLEITERKNG